MKDRTFPRWAAPLVGPVVGAILAARASRKQGQAPSPEWIVGGAVAGLLCGGLVWLLDRPSTVGVGAVGPGGGPVGAMAGPAEPANTVIGRFLLIMAVAFCWLPMFGLIMAVAATVGARMAGRRVGLALRIALGVGVVTTIGVVAIMVLSPDHR